jgi:hypothetical protein
MCYIFKACKQTIICFKDLCTYAVKEPGNAFEIYYFEWVIWLQSRYCAKC